MIFKHTIQYKITNHYENENKSDNKSFHNWVFTRKRFFPQKVFSALYRLYYSPQVTITEPNPTTHCVLHRKAYWVNYVRNYNRHGCTVRCQFIVHRIHRVRNNKWNWKLQDSNNQEPPSCKIFERECESEFLGDCIVFHRIRNESTCLTQTNKWTELF